MHHSVLPAASPTHLRRCMVLALAVVLVFGLSACSSDDTAATGGAGGSGGATGGAGATGGTGATGGDAGGSGGMGGSGGEAVQVTSTTIGPEGGTAVSADGAFEGSIPPGALAADTDITIETIAPADVPAGVIGNAYELGPDGLVLQQHAARLTATVSAADLGGEPPQSTRVAMEGAGGWYPILGAPPLTDPFKVSGFTTHFSRYAAVDFNPEKYCINQAVGSDPDPCACDMNAVHFCAAQLGISVWACGWTYAVYPVGGFMEEKLYDALDCYEGQTGYENVYETGGGTQCERNCCRSAEAPLYRAPHGAYECINRQGDSVAEACLASCAAQGNDKTQCELAGVPVCASCGEGLLHEAEQCEPSVQTFTTCNDIGLSGGPLGCNSNCTFDSSQCCVPLQQDACPGLTAGGDCGSFDDGCGGNLYCGCGVGFMCESNLCVPDPCYQVDCSGFPVPTDYCLNANTVVFHAGPFCSDGDCVAAQAIHNCPDDPDFHTYCTPGGLCVEP